LNNQSTRTITVDKITVHILPSNHQVGQKAAEDFATKISTIIANKGEAAAILATGNSMLTFFEALRARKDIAWNKITLFHMDEYLGMSDQHPASFPNYIRKHLTNHVTPKVFYPMKGDVSDTQLELRRYNDLLRKFPADICVLGIGENGHLAFNDPPADFATRDLIHIVTLDERCRMQQVNEGHFEKIEDVPKRAITLTVPALLNAKYVLAVVPEARKAEAVKKALEGPVTPDCPGSILRTRPNVTMYLDQESASQLP
jgi:glucosamine-6-phosphate deaminase